MSTEGTAKFSPFTEDFAVSKTAEVVGMELIRQRPVTISDKAAIKAAGLMRETPDYPRIRKLLESGATVPGASFGPIEYVLRHPHVTEAELDAEPT